MPENNPLRLEYIDPSSLDENPANWRIHSEEQINGIKAAIKETGWAGALLYNEKTKKLIDGHARKKIFPDQKVPVLIGNWDEETEKKILATLDPLSCMAEINTEVLDSIMKNIETENKDFLLLLGNISSLSGLFKANQGDKVISPADEWDGMPEFRNQGKSVKDITVYFETKEDVKTFSDLVGNKITDATTYIWFPEHKRRNRAGISYKQDENES